MAQLREKIRSMVRKEFVTRLLQEAEGDENRKVYRHSNYVALWDKFPMGSKSDQPSSEATKHDFVRWFMKTYINSPSPTHGLKPEYLARVKALLTPLVGKPDEFIETMNKERELVFGRSGSDNLGSNYRVSMNDSTDPVAKIVNMYIAFKEMRQNLGGTSAFDDVKLDDQGAPKAAAPEADSEGYDIIPGTAKKTEVAAMLAQDPTETTTEMSVTNRNRSAMKHLGGEVLTQMLSFLKDPSVESPEKKEVLKNLDLISKIVARGTKAYSLLFIRTIIAAYRNVKDLDNDAEVDKALIQGRDNFVKALASHGSAKNGINPHELNVFIAALNEVIQNDITVNDLAILCAKRPDDVDLYIDEMLEAVMDVFKGEMDKQTNFNSLGDYIDAMPEMKNIRQNVLMTMAKRGRPKGALNKKKGAEDDEEDSD